MPKLGCLGKVVIGVFVVLVLVILSAFLFPTPKPHVVLPGNYGADILGPELAAEAGEPFFQLGPLVGTNTLLASGLAIILLAVIFYLGTRKMNLIPKGWQNAVEGVYEALYNFVESAAGEKNARFFANRLASLPRKNILYDESDNRRPKHHKKASPAEKIDAARYTRQQSYHHTPVNRLFFQ